MRKITACIILISICLVSACGIKHNEDSATFSSSTALYDVVMKRDILCLMSAYWNDIIDVRREVNGKVYIVMKSGTQILYDDKKVKSYNEKLYSADLQDMMEQIYPLYDNIDLMSQEINPGRFRTYTLFYEVYGSTKQRVESNLENVKFGNSYLLFNRNNEASKALSRVNSELIPLLKTRSDITPFVLPSSGTFNFRFISGTNLLSVHSFGAAIDIAASGKDYWQWTSRAEGKKRLSVYPREVVRIFEKNNFIWGGKWGHFDMMHYEYRPELILKARYFPRKPVDGEMWYSGAPYSNIHVKSYIKKIDRVLK